MDDHTERPQWPKGLCHGTSFRACKNLVTPALRLRCADAGADTQFAIMCCCVMVGGGACICQTIIR